MKLENIINNSPKIVAWLENRFKTEVEREKVKKMLLDFNHDVKHISFVFDEFKKYLPITIDKLNDEPNNICYDLSWSSSSFQDAVIAYFEKKLRENQ